MRFASIGPLDSALFNGRFRLAGRYHCGWLRRSGTARVLEVHFFPDQEFRARLPYWHDHRQLIELQFDNADDFLRETVRDGILQGLRSGTVPAVSGRVSIEVEGFRAAITGGKPVYAVRFLSVEAPVPIDACQESFEPVV